MKYLITYLTKIICSALVICTTGWLTIILSLIFWNDNYLDYIENILVDIWDEE